MNKRLVAAALLCAGTCIAQTTQPATTTVSALPSYPRIRCDTGAVGLSFFYENDGGYLKWIDETDCGYTAGAGVAVQWQNQPTTELIGDLPSIGGEFDFERPHVSYGAGVIYSISIFTPVDLTDPQPIYDDRPYAGWAYVGMLIQRAQRDGTPSFESSELDLGTMGPSSRAGSLQEWVHKSFAQQHPEGWDNQVDDEFGVDFKYQRRWRFQLVEPQADTFGVDLIPDAGVAVGTIHINASAGATLRAGWQLPDDFGPAKMQYPGDFTRPFGRGDGVRDIGGYFFVRPGVMLVAHDATFGNSFFRDNIVSQDTEPFVAQGTVGACVEFLEYCQISYSQTFVSSQFKGQSEGTSYASLNFTFVYAW